MALLGWGEGQSVRRTREACLAGGDLDPGAAVAGFQVPRLCGFHSNHKATEKSSVDASENQQCINRYA